MKTRTGFVSNSSSSSFIIATKTPLTHGLMMSVFGVHHDSPLYQTVDRIARWFVDNSKKQVVDDYMQEYLECYDESPKLSRIFSEKPLLYMGRASDEDGAVEALICSLDLDYETSDIYIKKDGYY